MATYLTNDTDLGAVADAIRTKGGTSGLLAFPQGFVDAIEGIETGGSDMVTGSFVGNGTVSDKYVTTGKPVNYIYVQAENIEYYDSSVASVLIANFGVKNKLVAKWKRNKSGALGGGVSNSSSRLFVFGDTQVGIRTNADGGASTWIDGMTYNWWAW